MALLTSQQMSTAGAAVTYSSVSASDTFPAGTGRTFVHIKNAGASSDTVTVVAPGTVGPSLAIADLSFAVANGAEKFVGPIDPAVFASDGIVTITHSYTTSVTCAVVTI